MAKMPNLLANINLSGRIFLRISCSRRCAARIGELTISNDANAIEASTRGDTVKRAIAVILIGLFSGCATQQGAQNQGGTQLTAGLVQKEIRKGMSGDEVAIALGSPNIVSSDANGNAVWIYDRISSSVSSQSSSVYGTLLLIGGGSQSYSSNKSQQTFTVVIKFDDVNRVRDFAYHSTRF
ncbi:hypothetical protein [Nitrosococcus oceani]|uniref:hypothetical protein n=1 Tax=Nitrosococcus oceani TaxID=1229 RepID=UPI0018CCAED7|nr:hypothetical protein [Nitrosococcus oceani]